MREPNSVNVFLYRVSDGKREYLLFKRLPRPELGLPGFWQGITGGVESGEKIEETALREIKEESGIDILHLTPLVYSYEFPIKDEWKSMYPEKATFITEHVFTARVDKTPALSKEHNNYGWFSFSQAIDLLSFESNKKALFHVEILLNA